MIGANSSTDFTLQQKGPFYTDAVLIIHISTHTEKLETH